MQKIQRELDQPEVVRPAGDADDRNWIYYQVQEEISGEDFYQLGLRTLAEATQSINDLPRN